MAVTGRSGCRFAPNLMETIMQTHSGLNEAGTRNSLVTAARRGAFIGAALSALVASASAEPESAQGSLALHSGIGQSLQQNVFQVRQPAGVKCKKKGQIFTFPIVSADGPGVLSTTWSVVPPSGVASVAGTNPDPAWVTPPTGIFWEQAVTPPPPSNPINEQAGATDFAFKASFGPLPAPASLASIAMSGSFTADNDGAVYLNSVNLAHRVGYCPPTYGPPPAGYGAKCFTTTFPLSSVQTDYHAGMNTVIVDVHNNEFVSGFVIDGTVTAVCK
jgi:hypothetical protein